MFDKVLWAGNRRIGQWYNRRRRLSFGLTGTAFALLMIFALDLSKAVKAQTPLDLTPQETQWLTAHPVIRLGVGELPPLVLKSDGDDRFEGAGMDYIRLIESRLGIRFTIVFYPSWSQLLDAANDREVDVLITVPQTEERSAYLNFSPPYFINLRGTNASGVQDLHLADSYAVSSRNDWPELGAVLTKALNAVSTKEREMIHRRWITAMDQNTRLIVFFLGIAVVSFMVFLFLSFHQRVQNYFAGSIRRNLIMVVIVSAAPALGIILLSGMEMRSFMIQDAKKQAVELTTQTAKWVERVCRQNRRSLSALAQIPSLRAGQPDAGNDLLSSQKLLDIFVFNQSGDIVASGKPGLAGVVNIAHLEIAENAIRNDCFVVGSSVMSTTYAYPMIHFALPLAKSSASDLSSGASFIAKTVQLDTWGIEFDRAQFPQGADLMITDRHGILLFRYPVQTEGAALGQPIPKFEWDMVSGSVKSGVVTRPGTYGASIFFAYQQLSIDDIPSPDLYLIVSIPQSQLVAGANWLLWRNLILMAAMILWTIAITILMGNRMLLNLLDGITAAARRIGAGDLSARANVAASQKGELAELARTFDVMSANLESDKAEAQQAATETSKLLAEVEAAHRVLLSVTEDQRQAEIKVSKLNEELEQRVATRTAQLEDANKELEAFSYSVSHDLRAPLRAVDGYTRILIEDYGYDLDDEGKRVCSVISASAKDMGRLIDDLLAFSRLGRADMQLSSIDMAAMAKSIFFELTTSNGRERIDFHVGALPTVLGDPHLLRQVWINLLSNAIKFSSKKERAVIEVAGEERGGETVFSIRDNGAGFDMQYVGKLFGVFQRLHSKKEFEGTGVGLAIVQRIIHRHGGRVWAEGVPDNGATFYFTFQIATKPQSKTRT